MDHPYLPYTLPPAPAAPQAPGCPYDLAAVIPLTERKTLDIVKQRGYAITGFVLTDPSGRKCVIDQSAVRWFDDKAAFSRMMHPQEFPDTK